MKKTFQRLIQILPLVLVSAAFFACTPKDPKQKGVADKDIKKIEFLDVSDYAKWVFYSLKDNKVYKTVDYDLESCKLKEDLAKDTNWDIAFHRWDVMTRQGVYKSEITDLKKAYDVKLGDFTKDVEADVTIKFVMGGPGGKKAKEMISPLLSGGLGKKEGWCILSGMPPATKISENIWFVKTADGKIVALNFKDGKKKDGKNGAVTLDYVILK